MESSENGIEIYLTLRCFGIVCKYAKIDFSEKSTNGHNWNGQGAKWSFHMNREILDNWDHKYDKCIMLALWLKFSGN